MSAEVIRIGVLDMQVCVPDNWNDERVVEFANAENPCGTTHGWQIRKTGDRLLNGDPDRNPCESNSGRVHIMLDC